MFHLMQIMSMKRLNVSVVSAKLCKGTAAFCQSQSQYACFFLLLPPPTPVGMASALRSLALGQWGAGGNSRPALHSRLVVGPVPVW